MSKSPESSMIKKKSMFTWIICFAILPMMFVAGFCIIQLDNFLNYEELEKLKKSSTQVASILSDYEKDLKLKSLFWQNNKNLISHLNSKNFEDLKSEIFNSFKESDLNSLAFFNKSGEMLLNVFRNERGEIKYINPQNVEMSESVVFNLKSQETWSTTDFTYPNAVVLILNSRILDEQKEIIGYIEQTYSLNQQVVNNIGKRINTEIGFLNSEGLVKIASNNDLKFYEKSFFQEKIKPHQDTVLKLKKRGEHELFISSEFLWQKDSLRFISGGSIHSAYNYLRVIKYNLLYLILGLSMVVLILAYFVNKYIVPSQEIIKKSDKL